ncbi:tol-pal system protein YbgF [Ralstonia insidiosa]|uniref:Cell division coordinator CpoB n=1 Tax=Ralstonia insidiosa TaxID=190721 RepID=A0A848P6U9_9RALS|nr:tol-pal system protein YbgF [Ralstonia insidiosa]NMV40356.1 tol-pal system protein YbgF [Ralstonia insidiosa]
MTTMMKQRAYDTMRRAILMATLVAGGALTMAGPAAAGVFDDDEARRAIIDMREKFNTFQSSAAQRIDQNSKNLIDAQNQIETLKSEVARLRGQNEVLQNSVDTLTKQQKDYYADLDARLKKFEPQQATVEGREGTVQPGEKDEYDAALKRFQGGDFKGAGNQFSAFVKKYPQSPYLPLAQFWLGNALYAQRDYKGSSYVLESMARANPQHPKAADALLQVATNQGESGQKAAARKTLEAVVAQYPGSEQAKTAESRLKTMR